jgi:hypothetical protein
MLPQYMLTSSARWHNVVEQDACCWLAGYAVVVQQVALRSRQYLSNVCLCALLLCTTRCPTARLGQLEQAGQLKIPFTTGVLLGIGEGVGDTEQSLRAIADIATRYGHIQVYAVNTTVTGTSEVLASLILSVQLRTHPTTIKHDLTQYHS